MVPDWRVTGGQACVGGKFEAVGDGRAVANLGEDTGAGPWPDPWPRRARTDILRPWGRICLLLQQAFLFDLAAQHSKEMLIWISELRPR